MLVFAGAHTSLMFVCAGTRSSLMFCVFRYPRINRESLLPISRSMQPGAELDGCVLQPISGVFFSHRVDLLTVYNFRASLQWNRSGNFSEDSRTIHTDCSDVINF